jgi:hypothetical protein
VRGAIGFLVVAALAVAFVGWRRGVVAAAVESETAEALALEAEREGLQRRLDALVPNDKRLAGMPRTALRIGIPTSLARDLVKRVTAGLVDQLTLVLENLRYQKTGTLRKVVVLGEYTLDVNVDQVMGRLHTGEPDIQFGGNQVKVSLPVSIASGSGRATIHFQWDGRSVAGAMCGDLDITREVTGLVKPDRYTVGGTLLLASTAEHILMSPRFPTLNVNLKVLPSAESWAAAEKVIADQEGVCGFVLSRVDVLQVVRNIVDKGFNVRLPTEKLKPMEVPVGFEPSLTVRGQTLTLGLRVASLAITEDAIWLGADVGVLAAPATSAGLPRAAPPPSLP